MTAIIQPLRAARGQSDGRDPLQRLPRLVWSLHAVYRRRHEDAAHLVGPSDFLLLAAAFVVEMLPIVGWAA